ncbi:MULTISPECIES: SDR family oxidoreductase [unclassified Methylobacterium]
MTQPILIAGATGTNGRELVGRLAARSIPIRLLVRDPAKAEALRGPTVELVRGDLADRGSLDRAMDGVRTAYVVTGIMPNTVELFGNFFQAAGRAGVSHVVKFSGLGADVNSPSTVIRQHGEADQLLIGSGLNYTILRPNSFHQNMLWMASSIRADGRFYMPMGEARQSTIDVRDIADVTVKVLTEAGHAGRIYDLTGPESLSFHEVADRLSAVVGRTVTYVPISVDAAEQAMRANGMPEWNARTLAEIQSLFASGAYADVDPTTAELLGRPATRFAQFAADHAEQFR